MAFEFGQARQIDSADAAAQTARAFRKIGKPVVLVPIFAPGPHAGHIALIRAAKRIPGAVVMVASPGNHDVFAAEAADAVWVYDFAELWPKGPRTLVQVAEQTDHAEKLARFITLLLAVGPSDAIVGEKDYELLILLQQACRDLHIPVKLHSVPVVRMPGGLAISHRNSGIAPEEREQAIAISAALTAGAHSAEDGAASVEATTRGVLEAAGVQPDYVRVVGTDLGPAPDKGDARLLVQVTLPSGVQLRDSVGVPVGIGFRNIE